MLPNIRLIATVSRLEFIPALASFFIIGLSWGINPASTFQESIIPAFLVFVIILLSCLVGLQLNTLFDQDLDKLDERKTELVQAYQIIGPRKLKHIIIAESIIAFISVILLEIIQGKPILPLMWIIGLFLAYAYSAPPLRFKSKSLLSLFSLILCICIFPLLFSFYTFSSEINNIFIIFLIGQALVAYSTIISAEIRDYFEDFASGTKSMAVKLGLLKASIFSIVLLSLGGILTGTAFFIQIESGTKPFLNVFLLTIIVADYIVIRKYVMLYSLSRTFMSLKTPNSNVMQEIRKYANNCPQWILLVSQALVIMSIILLLSKFF